MVSSVGLQCVIVVFPDNTHFLLAFLSCFENTVDPDRLAFCSLSD